MNKLYELHLLLSNNMIFSTDNINIFAISETWCKDYVTDALLTNNTPFNVFRSDRLGRCGGGVCLLIHNCLRVTSITKPDVYKDLEVIAVDIGYSSYSKRRLIAVYRAPNSGTEYINLLCDYICYLCRCAYPCIFVGDFNFPDFVWPKNLNLGLPSFKENNGFFNCLVYNSLLQLVNFPTRGQNILDLLLCNAPEIIFDLRPTLPFSVSDHNGFIFSFHVDRRSRYKECETTINTFDLRNLKHFKIDYCAINNALFRINWFLLFGLCDVNGMWNIFINALKHIIFTYSTFMGSAQKRAKYPAHIRRLQRFKLYAWRNRHRDGLKNYKRMAKAVKSAIIRYSSKFEKKIIASKDSKKFFSYINKKICLKSPVHALSDANGIHISENLQMANILNDYFATVFNNKTSQNFDMHKSDNVTVGETRLMDIDFHPQLVFNALCKLKKSWSCGPDYVPSIVLKLLANSICLPLSLIFKKSFANACLPNIWLQAHVVPVFKKGSRLEPSNYRPISLTCICCKVMETIIKKHLVRHLISNDLISHHQHGFVPGKNTSTQLLECFNAWTKLSDATLPFDIVYIDFKKAFDKVSHEHLIKKLYNCGLDVSIIMWIKAFLRGRSQCVKINNCISKPCVVLSGVPQGSVLGPVLFLIFINDLPLSVHDCCIKLFADDIKIWRIIRTLYDKDMLQKCLNSIVEWSVKWELPISVEKSMLMHVGFRNPKFDFIMNNISLPVVDKVCDLGVYYDCHLSFSDHYVQLASKSMQRVKLILKCFSCNDIDALMTAFNVYVRPIMEYACIVWNPQYVGYISMLEKVQKYFTRCLFLKCNLIKCCYSDRLRLLNCDSLELRRLRADLVESFKYVKGFIISDLSNEFLLCNSKVTRGHMYKLSHACFKTNVRKFFLTNRIFHPWNSLNGNMFNTSVIKSFYLKLFDVDLSEFVYL